MEANLEIDSNRKYVNHKCGEPKTNGSLKTGVNLVHRLLFKFKNYLIKQKCLQKVYQIKILNQKFKKASKIPSIGLLNTCSLKIIVM